MAISTVKRDLDAIADLIAGSQSMFDAAKARILAARNQLAAIPTTYATTLSEINGYTPTGAFETLAQDEKAKLTTEFQALKGALESALTDLGVSYA